MFDDLREHKKAIGARQTVKAIENGSATLVIIAGDAEEKVVRDIRELCLLKSVKVEYVESMKQLGKICGIDVGASTACLLI